MLQQQDILALNMIIKENEGDFCLEIKKRIKDLTCVAREETGVGFYSSIKLIPPLETVPEVKLYEFNFNHPDFPHGGSYMCWILNEHEMELEAVTFGGTDWPNPIDPVLFESL